MNDTFARVIIDSKITFMNLSVNAATPETYKKVAPKGRWDKTISKFKNFMSLKRASQKRTPFSRVQIIDQECARGEIEDFMAMFVDDADIIATNTLEAFSKDVEENISYAEQRARPSRKTCNRITRKDMFIFSNGETTFCDTDFNGQYSLGNVRGASISDIWNSDVRNRFVEKKQIG